VLDIVQALRGIPGGVTVDCEGTTVRYEAREQAGRRRLDAELR
jgi:hypothetical protein